MTVAELREFLTYLPKSCDDLPIRMPNHHNDENIFVVHAELHETGDSGYEESGEVYLMGTLI